MFNKLSTTIKLLSLLACAVPQLTFGFPLPLTELLTTTNPQYDEQKLVAKSVYLIGWHGHGLCTAVAISETQLLTAEHCLFSINDPTKYGRNFLEFMTNQKNSTKQRFPLIDLMHYNKNSISIETFNRQDLISYNSESDSKACATTDKSKCPKIIDALKITLISASQRANAEYYAAELNIQESKSLAFGIDLALITSEQAIFTNHLLHRQLDISEHPTDIAPNIYGGSNQTYTLFGIGFGKQNQQNQQELSYQIASISTTVTVPYFTFFENTKYYTNTTKVIPVFPLLKNQNNNYVYYKPEDKGKKTTLLADIYSNTNVIQIQNTTKFQPSPGDSGGPVSLCASQPQSECKLLAIVHGCCSATPLLTGTNFNLYYQMLMAVQK